MATSFTALLGLAIPVTGELAGTWGDTVSNSITSLLDTAVAGTTTLSTDADVTLTTTTGAANQARQAILLCSGARTAVRNITAPAQSKIYAVINNTTGGYGVVIRGAGPTTGVTVANGKTAIVVWNGSDFVEVAPASTTTATNLAGGAAGSVPYQSGAGTTAFLGIGAAAQVLQVNAGATAPEWVSTTGTGNVVRATSPTLATPTFTTLATFPLHIGGTGTTSTLTLRSTSGVGTTGADIIFQTGNNGATEAMRILNSGDVGIGTASPSAPLTIGSSAANVLLANGASTGASYFRVTNTSGDFVAGLNNSSATTISGGIAYASFVGSNNATALHWITNGTVRATVDASGNVGIGVLPSAWSQGRAIELLEAGYGVWNGTGSTYSLANAYFNSGFKYANTGAAASHYYQFQGAHVWSNAPSGTAGNAISFTQAMTLDASGNLLVGITSQGGAPGKTVIRSDNPLSFFNEATSAVSNIGYLESGATLRFGNYYSTGSNLTFYTNANGSGEIERMRLDASGNLGLGVTPSAWGSGTKAIQVNNQSAFWSINSSNPNAWVSANTYFDNTNFRYINTAVATAYQQSNGQHLWFTAPSGTAGNAISFTQAMTLDASGNLLVGATATSSYFDARANFYSPSVYAAFGGKQGGGASAFVSTHWHAATSGDNAFIAFVTESSPTIRGSIDYNRAGGLVQYNTTSDYRAKDIIGPVQNVGATIDALKVYEGVMKGATQSRPMLIAHEAQEHAPYAVSGVKDEVNEDGTPKFQQMDVSSLVPLLLAEIQSLRARVASLEAN